MLKGKKFDAFTLKEIVSSAAQQLLCNRTSAVVRLSAKCCALVKRLLCSKLSTPFIILQSLPLLH